MADLSSLSDEELQRMVDAPAPNVSGMSDEQLMAIASGKPAQKQPFSWSSALGETLPARLAKGAYESVKSAVTLPGDVYSGEAKIPSSGAVPSSVPFGSPQSSGERVADLAMLASPVSVAMRAGESVIPAARAITTTRYEPQTILQGHGLPTTIDSVPVKSTSYEPVLNRTPVEPKVPPADTLRNVADSQYASARLMPVEINPQALVTLSQKIQSQLDERGLIRKSNAANPTRDALDMLGSPPQGSTATYGNIISARQALNKASQKFSDRSEQEAAVHAIQELDQFLKRLETNPPPNTVVGPIADANKLYRDANSNWGTQARSNLITGKVDTSELRDVANDRQNIGNTLRNRMADLVLKPKEASGFSEGQLATAEDIARAGGQPVYKGAWLIAWLDRSEAGAAGGKVGAR